jgi:hypothetical protein
MARAQIAVTRTMAEDIVAVAISAATKIEIAVTSLTLTGQCPEERGNGGGGGEARTTTPSKEL